MSKLKTNTIQHTGGSADNITLDNSQNVTAEGNLTVDGNLTVSGTSTISGYHPTSSRNNRNLIINGAFNVAQRGTSSTSAGYQTVDRFTTSMAGTDEACTFAQVDVTAGTDPWNAGFRKAFKVTNGNQTSGAGAADDVSISQNIESQDLSNSGWDYTSSSSYITLSFWAKSSVAQTFYTGFRIYGDDQREYCFSYALSANTWTKVTHSIPGGSGHTLLNTNALGAFIQWPLWWGTDYTSSGRAVDTWQIKNNAANYPDNTSTWYTTNDATFEITGVQLEVGSVATDFEHRSYGDEIARCQRYYWNSGGTMGGSGQSYSGNTTDGLRWWVSFPTKMRTSPTVTLSGGSDGSSNASFQVISSNSSGALMNLKSTDSSTSVWWMGATLYTVAEL